MLLVRVTFNVELDPVESFGSVQRLSEHLWTCLATLGCLWKPSVIFKSCRAISEIPVMMEGKSQAFGSEKGGRLYFKTILISDGRYRKFVML